MKDRKIRLINLMIICSYCIAIYLRFNLIGAGCLVILFILNYYFKEKRYLLLTQGIALFALTTFFPSVTFLLFAWIVVLVFLKSTHQKLNEHVHVVFNFILVIIHFFTSTYVIVNIIVIVMIAMLCFSLLQMYFKMKRKYMFLGCVSCIIYVVLGAILPFMNQPEVSESTIQSFDAQTFIEATQTKEKAKILSDNGDALEERIRLITQAKKEIILSTFEFDADISGQQMLAALLDASQRGVRVSILVDGFPYLKAMAQNPYFLALSRQQNVQIKQYNPISVLVPWSMMGRMHDKYLVVDDLGYIMGGRNTYDFFLGNQEGYKNYDWDIYVLGNQSLKQIKDYFINIWNLDECHLIGEQLWMNYNVAVNDAEKSLIKTYRKMKKENANWFEWQEEGMVEVDKISLISNPTHILAKEPVVFYQMSELMSQATQEVMIHTPYIICNDYMLERLSGIPHSTIMTNSVVNNGNPFGAMDYQMNKPKIIATGTKLLEYEQGISYHGKCFTIDDHLTGIGSFNWDMRSAYLDTEVMAIVSGKEFNEQCRSAMRKYEDEALVVLDEKTYLLKEGQMKKEGSCSQAILLKILEILGSWARFLM